MKWIWHLASVVRVVPDHKQLGRSDGLVGSALTLDQVARVHCKFVCHLVLSGASVNKRGPPIEYQFYESNNAPFWTQAIGLVMPFMKNKMIRICLRLVAMILVTENLQSHDYACFMEGFITRFIGLCRAELVHFIRWVEHLILTLAKLSNLP